ncbi:UDP-2,4-diacetamido-2,4,6-trideoxy-beta-L-altropyranose hydrolase [Alicyclobacillus macrosporangiidus]|uniref:UDP-2,4-diacetamido-2,4, 6-trideoxy-beta-L-altropyranose hydrolase n=1 Tax=Alicyclobacillus macrosporangiidus TaxID=392015 RepID=UPI0009DD1A75
MLTSYKNVSGNEDSMRVHIRADASHEIGTGHVMRCITLADVLRQHGTEVSFSCRTLSGHMCDELVKHGYPVHRVPRAAGQYANDWDELRCTWRQDALSVLEYLGHRWPDWVVVDHYALDAKWEREFRQRGIRVLAVDDLADRDHDCDLLLDQNAHPDCVERYHGRLPAECNTLLGPRYALLRDEFVQARQRASVRDGQVRRVLVSFGGADTTNETCKALRGMTRWGNVNSCAIDVVVGPINPNIGEIQDLAKRLPLATVHVNTSRMAELMASADLALGAGGTTTWERCCLGLPTWVTIVAENQRQATAVLERMGVVCCLGESGHTTDKDYADIWERLQATQLRAMSARGMELVDGLGTRRVVDSMFAFHRT